MIVSLFIAAGIFALCAALRKRLTGTAPRKVTAWVRLEPMYNRAGAFGLKLPRRLLELLSALCLGLLALAALPARGLSSFGGALALGGGLSNLYERLRYKGVLDYLRFPRLPGRGKKYVYNAADLAIFAGLLLLLLGQGRRGK